MNSTAPSDTSGMDVLGMNISNPGSHLTASHHAHPYASSISSSASSSSSSVFSLDCVSSSSISSTSTNPVDVIWENEGQGRNTGALPRAMPKGLAPKADGVVPSELRTHPRRTNSYASSAPSARPPPCLLRQSERKVNFVDNLVGKSYTRHSDMSYGHPAKRARRHRITDRGDYLASLCSGIPQ